MPFLSQDSGSAAACYQKTLGENRNKFYRKLGEKIENTRNTFKTRKNMEN
jgi:hypothetical protein